FHAPEDRQRSLAPNLGRRRKNIHGVEEKCKAAASTLQQRSRALFASIHQSRPRSPAIRLSNASSGTAHPLLAAFPVLASYAESLTESATPCDQNCPRGPEKRATPPGSPKPATRFNYGAGPFCSPNLDISTRSDISRIYTHLSIRRI